jgi:D-tyrosyl-tRNA(Tyr) deacylase
MAEKVANLRILRTIRENESLAAGRQRRGPRRFAICCTACPWTAPPKFHLRCSAGKAKAVYKEFGLAMQGLGVSVATGIFQAIMSVELVNEGPVTILLDSEKTF